MAGIKLEGFQGIIPRVSERLLPPMAATDAKNTKLLQGELRGYRVLVEEADFSAGAVSPVRRAYRIPNTPSDTYLTFDTRDVDVVRSPIINDAYDRYFWAGDGTPKMNTAARIKNSDPPFLLGIPTPNNAPSVTPPAGSDETRAYVYTFVSAYGEEGPPSPPTIATGAAGTPWNIANIDTTVPDATQRNITHVNIYRTVPGNVSSSFFFVAQVSYTSGSGMSPSPYADNETNETVAANNLLESESWVAPSPTMEGFIAMPNGFLVGWDGRRILFSEPYRPHAWPPEYELATEFDIVGMGVVGSTLVIGTQSQPYFGMGVNPSSFTTQKIDTVEPCLSRRGMVSTTAGVVYPSINGLVLANSSGIRVITEDLFTKEEWAAVVPSGIFAAQLGLQYIAFTSSNAGFILDPKEPAARYITLDGFSQIDGIETDRYTGNVSLISSNHIYAWDSEATEQRLQWTWKSKLYQTPKPINFGAARLHFITGNLDFTDEIVATYGPYNTSLFTAINSQPGAGARLNTLNGQVLGGSPAANTGLVAGWDQPETRQPLGGSLLYPVNALSFQTNSVRVIIRIDYENAEKKVVFDKVIQDENIFRLPTGFKSDLWQIELIGNTTLYSMQIAETPKQLAGI